MGNTEKLRLYADRVHLPPEDVAYLLGLLREEREACAGACDEAAKRWPENPHVAAVLRSMAEEIRDEG